MISDGDLSSTACMKPGSQCQYQRPSRPRRFLARPLGSGGRPAVGVVPGDQVGGLLEQRQKPSLARSAMKARMAQPAGSHVRDDVHQHHGPATPGDSSPVSRIDVEPTEGGADEHRLLAELAHHGLDVAGEQGEPVSPSPAQSESPLAPGVEGVAVIPAARPGGRCRPTSAGSGRRRAGTPPADLLGPLAGALGGNRSPRRAAARRPLEPHGPSPRHRDPPRVAWNPSRHRGQRSTWTSSTAIPGELADHGESRDQEPAAIRTR